ncbi:MAG: hypothetical protein ACOX5A_07940 [Aminivibrio sp.]|jgi:hypothetical protein
MTKRFNEQEGDYPFRERVEPKLEPHVFASDGALPVVVWVGENYTAVRRPSQGIIEGNGDVNTLILADEIRAAARLGRPYFEIHEVEGGTTLNRMRIRTERAINKFYEAPFPMGPWLVANFSLYDFEAVLGS